MADVSDASRSGSPRTPAPSDRSTGRDDRDARRHAVHLIGVGPFERADIGFEPDHVGALVTDLILAQAVLGPGRWDVPSPPHSDRCASSTWADSTATPTVSARVDEAAPRGCTGRGSRDRSRWRSRPAQCRRTSLGHRLPDQDRSACHLTLVLRHGMEQSTLTTSLLTRTPTIGVVNGSAARVEITGPFHIPTGFVVRSPDLLEQCTGSTRPVWA